MLAYDKKLHLFTGTILTVGMVLLRFDKTMIMATLLFVASFKEVVYDVVVPEHTTDPMDALATICGGSLGYIITTIIKYGWRG